MRNATLLLLAIALVGCREAQPEHEPTEAVVTPDARPAGSPPGVSGGAEGTAEEAYAAWLAAQETATVVVSNARVEGERPIPPAETAASSPQSGAGAEPLSTSTNAGSTPAPSATTSLRAAIEASQWPPHEWLAVETVVMCESSGSTTARNGPHAGLLQMNEGLHGAVPAGAIAQLNDAYELWLVAGWSAWECA